MSVLVVRPVRLEDLASLLDLAELASFGLTTLPKDEKLLARRVRDSLRAFERVDDEEPRGECYLFVLEDLDERRVIGTCGIASKVGGFKPFYAYRVHQEVLESKTLGIRRDIRTLHPFLDHDGPSEIGSLFLHPAHRRGPGGRALSLSRFLFMACRPSLFDSRVIAEIRGVVDVEGRSPFWDAIGRHFFDMEFPKADFLSVVNKEFIGELMPRHPIYVPLLPAEAREVIGVAHPESVAAMKILEDEGFRFSGMVDIFEAGPIVACERERIRTARESVEAPIARIVDAPGGPAESLMVTARAEFRACPTWLVAIGDGVEVPREAADALSVRVGDVVRHVPIRGSAK